MDLMQWLITVRCLIPIIWLWFSLFNVVYIPRLTFTEFNTNNRCVAILKMSVNIVMMGGLRIFDVNSNECMFLCIKKICLQHSHRTNSQPEVGRDKISFQKV